MDAPTEFLAIMAHILLRDERDRFKQGIHSNIYEKWQIEYDGLTLPWHAVDARTSCHQKTDKCNTGTNYHLLYNTNKALKPCPCFQM